MENRALKTGEFIALCALLISLTAFSIDGVLPAFRQISDELALGNPADTRYLVSLFFLGMVVGDMIVGPVSDAVGRKKALIGGLVIFCIGTLIAISAQSLEILLLGRFVQGIGVSGPKVITRALVRDLYEGAAMARIMSFVMMVFILVPMLAPVLGQGIMIVANWQGIFVFYLVMAIIMMFWLGLRQPETLAAESRVQLSGIILWRNGKRIFGHRRVMACSVAAGIVFGGQLLYLSLAPTLFFDLYGVKEMFPLWFALLALSIGFTSFVNGKLVMRLGMYRLSMFALITQVVLNVIFLGICLVWDGVPPFWLFMIMSSLSMACLGMLFGNINAMAMQSLGRVAGLGASLVSSLSSTVAVGVAMFWGYVYDQTLFAFVLAFLSAALVSMALMMLANKSDIGPV